jgi:hypothetical protein
MEALARHALSGVKPEKLPESATMVSMTRTLALALLCVSAACAQTANHFVLVAHSGAGDYSQTPPNVIQARRDGMLKAVRAGYAILARGGSSTFNTTGMMTGTVRADGKIKFAGWSKTAEPVYVPAQ